jgi:pyrroline-5-carboxylate reductase
VEPKNFSEVMPEIAECFSKDKILVSIAAGITIETLESYLGPDAKVIRTMPNTPIMHGLGVTAMVRNPNVNESDFNAVKKIFESGGITGEVSEDLISAVIGVSGSSPAYTYMYIDALISAGIESGMDPDMSKRFAAQAVMGAARMVLESDEAPSALCDKVCTPGGTTIEAVNSLKEAGFEGIVKSGAEAAVKRSIEMSKK